MAGVGRNLPTGLPLGGEAASAHPAVDPATGNLVLFTYHVQLAVGGDKSMGEQYWCLFMSYKHSCIQ